MAISSKDIVSLSHARARLTELCEEVQTKGSEKIITKNGESCVALIEADASITTIVWSANTSTLVCFKKPSEAWTTLKGGRR